MHVNISCYTVFYSNVTFKSTYGDVGLGLVIAGDALIGFLLVLCRYCLH
jgi:hypothetical protein